MKFLKKIDKSELMGKVTRAASKYGYKLKKASPTIMIVGAAVGGVTATVLACKATIKAQDILKEHNAAVQTIHDTKAKIDSGELVLGEGETYTENKDGKELFRYTAKEEGEDEEEATIALLAYENHCRKCSIHTHLEWR